MATFPVLKTGAVAQYPTDRNQRCSTSVYRFLDGGEQRFQRYAGPLRSWTIRLDLLDEAELTNLRSFFEQMNGRAGTFAFTDPWDGTSAASCSFGADSAAFDFAEVGQGKTTLTIKENRS